MAAQLDNKRRRSYTRAMMTRLSALIVLMLAAGPVWAADQRPATHRLGNTGWSIAPPKGFVLNKKPPQRWERIVPVLVGGRKERHLITINALHDVTFMNGVSLRLKDSRTFQIVKSKRFGHPVYRFRSRGVHLGGTDQDSYVLAHNGTGEMSEVIFLAYGYQSDFARTFGLEAFEEMIGTLVQTAPPPEKQTEREASGPVPMLR